MTPQEFEHVVRAVGAALGVKDVLVIGSQAVHASLRTVIPEALRSIEVDVSSLTEDPEESADLIDGNLGELSLFHETHGYYAQGVTPKTATLPRGWRERLVVYEAPGTAGVRAHCLDLHDLWLSKAVAGRPKDREFCVDLRKTGVISDRLLLERLDEIDGLEEAVRAGVRASVTAGRVQH